MQSNFDRVMNVQRETLENRLAQLSVELAEAHAMIDERNAQIEASNLIFERHIKVHTRISSLQCSKSFCRRRSTTENKRMKN